MLSRSQVGFTLVELMIVVVIIGVITAIAYPSYTNWVLEARRSDGYALLTRAAALQEKRLSECAAYTTSASGNLTDCAAGGLGMATTSPDGHYTITLATPSTTSFTLTATPVATSPQINDTNCPTLTLNSLGQKGPANCWK